MPSIINATRATKGQKWPQVPFPSDTPTHPLLVVDYIKIEAGDKEEIDQLYEACTSLGFFYLKNYGFETAVDATFTVGEDIFSLQVEDLLPFEQGDSGRTAGYKRAGGSNVDAKGNVDTVEFMNISKDDALAYPEVRQREYPPVVNDNMPTLTDFVLRSDTVLKKLLSALEPRVGLPSGTLLKLHANGPPHLSGSEARLIFKPATGALGAVPEGVGEDGKPSAAIGSHTDFGSFSMLHGRGCGGLQVLPPGTSEWQYIKPLKGHAVCNVGDTLSVYTGGILRSNVHRVVPPPGEQSRHARWSLVFFLRPSFDDQLFPLVRESEQIAKAAKEHPTISKMEEGVTAGQWFFRRVAGQRSANRKGPESWKQSRGTEHNPNVD